MRAAGCSFNLRYLCFRCRPAKSCAFLYVSRAAEEALPFEEPPEEDSVAGARLGIANSTRLHALASFGHRHG